MRTFFVLAFLSSSAVHAKLVDGIAAIINGDVITFSEVDERTSLAHQDRAHALADLVGERLLEADVRSLHLEVTPDELDRAVDEVRKENNLDADRFEQALKSQGLTMERYRAQLSKQIARMKLMQVKVKGKVTISDEDVKTTYRQETATAASLVHARHLFVAVKEGSPIADVQAGRTKAERALAEIKAGKEFAVAAKQYSDAPTAHLGGDLGFIRRGELLPEIEQAAFALAPGQVSEVIRARGGFHLVKVEEKKLDAPPDFEHAKDAIRERLMRAALEKEAQRYVQQLRKEASVEVKLQGADGKAIELPAPAGP